MKNMYISFVGGKSGGHILPCVARAQEMLAQTPTAKILFFTSTSSLDATILEKYSFINTIVSLPIHSFNLKKWSRMPLYCAQFVYSFLKSLFILHRYKPCMLISMGGLISLPVCLAGKLLGIPITLQELNVVPGKAVKTLAPLAKNILVCFDETRTYFAPRPTHKSDYPVRFAPTLRNLTTIQAREHLGLHSDIPTLMIVGGSQGSLFLNNLVKQWIVTKPHMESLQIIHQLGNQELKEWQAFYTAHNILAHVFSFHHEIEYYYAAANVIICRSGAGTLFEILFFNKNYDSNLLF